MKHPEEATMWEKFKLVREAQGHGGTYHLLVKWSKIRQFPATRPRHNKTRKDWLAEYLEEEYQYWYREDLECQAHDYAEERVQLDHWGDW